MLTGLAVVLAVLAVGAGVVGIHLLLGRGWWRGWLRGTAGLALALLATFTLLAAWDLQAYRHLQAEQPIAELTFAELGPRHYRVKLEAAAVASQQYELAGELWQLDVRLLRWHPALLRLGIAPAYRLDRLSGRYLSVDDELARPRTVIALGEPATRPDIWQWAGRQTWLPLVDTRYGSGAYLPMRHGARFAVSLGTSGLVARPLNDAAKDAVSGWR